MLPGRPAFVLFGKMSESDIHVQKYQAEWLENGPGIAVRIQASAKCTYRWALAVGAPMQKRCFSPRMNNCPSLAAIEAQWLQEATGGQVIE